VKEGLPHGQGILIDKGSIYEGEFSKGLKNGLGRFINEKSVF